ncbi:MAG: sodium:solute symporter family protein [Firmicutes bacterium]|nr:sodium:solute symporter family protein [Bacillota bacterium]
MEPRVVLILSAVAAYVAISMYIGLRGARSTTTTLEDYFLGNRSFGLIFMAFTFYATYQSAYMYIGCTGFVYSHGMGIWYSNVANLLWAFLFLVIGIPMWKLAKKFHYVTQGDFFAHRFDSDVVRMVMAFWMILGLAPYIGSQVKSVSLTLETLTGGVIPFHWGAVIFIATVGFYSITGGARGVVWTDLVQGLIMLVAIWFGLAYLLPQVGGVGGVMKGIAEKHPALLGLPGAKGLLTPQAWFGYMLCDALGGIMWIQNWVRFYMCKTWKTLAAMAVIVPIGTTLTFYPAMLYGFAGKLLVPNLEKADAIMPTLILGYLPVWVGALIVVGLFAASMSTVDSLALALASSVAKDVHQKINPQVSQAKLVGTGKVWTAVFLLGGMLVGYYAKDTYLVVLLTLLSLSLSATLFPVAVAGLFWKRANKQGVIAGLAAGTIVGAKMLLGGPEFDPVFGIYGGVWGMIVTTVVMVVVSLLTPPTNKDITSVIDQALRGKLDEA